MQEGGKKYLEVKYEEHDLFFIKKNFFINTAKPHIYNTYCHLLIRRICFLNNYYCVFKYI